MDHLALYSRKCKFCSYLDPSETKQYEKCYYKNGNTECPAQEVQLAVVGEAKRLAILIKKARTEGNIEKEVKILEIVSKRDPAFQQKFREWS